MLIRAVSISNTDYTDYTDKSLRLGDSLICGIRARFLYIFRSRGESASRLGTGVP